MRIAVIDQPTGDIIAVITPQMQAAPFIAEAGRALVIVDSHPAVAEITDAEIIDGYLYDFASQEFIVR